MILITGDFGFIGKHLCKQLQGKEMVGFDLARGEDIRNNYHLWSAFEAYQPSVVVHLAARAGVRKSKHFPDEYISTNIIGTQNVVNACESFGVKRLIFFSSSSVFGNQKLPITEESPKEPKSLYGITKLAGEMIVKASKVPSVIVRPFTVYGEGGRRDSVIWRWIDQVLSGKAITAYGDGTSSRGYVYIKDLTRTVEKLILMELWEWQNEDFNMGGSVIITLRDLIEVFSSAIPNLKVSWQPAFEEDIYQQYTDTAKAERMLGFHSGTDFREKVKAIIQKSLLMAL